MSDNVSLGEVYRLCQRIESAVDKQNGRVRKLENDVLRIKTIWSVAVVGVGLTGDYLKHKLFGS